MKTGWLWLCAYFNKNIDKEVMTERKLKFDAEFVKNNGDKPNE